MNRFLGGLITEKLLFDMHHTIFLESNPDRILSRRQQSPVPDIVKSGSISGTRITLAFSVGQGYRAVTENDNWFKTRPDEDQFEGLKLRIRDLALVKFDNQLTL